MSTTAYEASYERDALAPLPFHLLTSDALELASWLTPPGQAEETILYSSIGDRLPPVALTSMAFEWYCQQAEVEGVPLMQPQLLETTVVSSVTGCWLPADPDRYRAPGGYITAGDKSAGVSPSGSTTRHRATNQRHELARGGEPLNSEIQVDHICRNTACYCPFHVRRMDGETNNELKKLARRFELALAANQLFMCMDTSWVDELAKDGDAKIVTRYGAFLLERLDEHILVGNYQPDPYLEALRKPAPYRHTKEKLKLSEGQDSLDLSLFGTLLAEAIRVSQKSSAIAI